MVADVLNPFIQATIDIKDGQEKIIMKITGELVDIMVKIALHKYAKYVVYENGRKTIYVVVLQAIYGMLISTLRWYQKFCKDLENEGFIFNPYDPCVANKIINGNNKP